MIQQVLNKYKTFFFFFYKFLVLSTRYILLKFLYGKKIKYNDQVISCQFHYILVNWLKTNQLPQNGQVAMPHCTGFQMLLTIVCTKKHLR